MDRRTQLRTQIRQRRQQISPLLQQQAAKNLKNSLCEHEKIIQAQHIALYLSNDGELDTIPFIQWCWQQKKQLYLPVLHPFSQGNLLFLHYHPNTVMVKNKFGILEPKLNITHLCLLENLDVLLTPLVAFDHSGARLGMGGGFYDRTLARWYKKTSPIKLYPIGVAHDCQQVEHIAVKTWDVPLPEIITPTKNYLFGSASPQ